MPNPHKGHVNIFNDYVADLQIFAVEALRGWNQGSLHMLAHSMGGNIGLHFLCDHPGLFATAVHTAPMIGVPAPGGIVTLMARMIAEICCMVGLGKRYIPGGGDYGRRDTTFPGNPLTSDEPRFQRTKAYIRRTPALALGAPTLGWLRAGMRSGATLLDPAYARDITTPNLLICAGNERVVDNRATYRLQRAGLPNVRIETIPGARHEILSEQDNIRALFWSLFDDFTGTTVS